MAKSLKQRPVRHYVKEWRKKRNLTQERLAERIDKTHGAISQIETGAVELTPQMLHAIADALNVEPGFIVGFDPTKDGDVIDLVSKFRRAKPDQQKQILAVVNALSA